MPRVTLKQQQQPGRSGQEGTTTSGVQGAALSPAEGAGGGDLISGTLNHHPHTSRLPGDKQIQTGFNPQG